MTPEASPRITMITAATWAWLSEMVEAGLMVGPRIFSTGFILYGADNPGRAVVDSLDEMDRHPGRGT